MPQHQTFVDYFVHEFMEELWYLQKVARGDIPKRQEADPLKTFFNVTQALLSIAPIPGLPLGFLLSKELIAKCVEYGEQAFELIQQAQEMREKAQQFLDGLDTAQSAYKTLTGQSESKGMLQQEGPMDLVAIRVLVELIGRGLAERYEHVLSEYLGDPPEKSQIPLARVMAKRLFAYLQNEPLLAEGLEGGLLAQRNRLLNGVVLGNIDKTWRQQLTKETSHLLPRAVREMHKVSLPLKPVHQQQLGRLEHFTAEGVFKRSAWYDETQVYAHNNTDWQTTPGNPRQPKYGHAYLGDSRQLPQTLEGMQACRGTQPPPRATQYARSVGLAEIQAYLNSPQVQTARTQKTTTTFSFHDFLRSTGHHPNDLEAVCHADLTQIQDWSFANFSGVDFSGATITGNLSGTDFSNTYLVSLTAQNVHCTLTNPVNLKSAKLGFGDWRGAQLPKADLSQADLSLTNLSQADLTEVQSTGANWYKTDLSGVTRQDLLAEQQKQVTEAKVAFEKRMQELDARVTQVEQKLAEMFERLDQLSATSRESKTEDLRIQIEALQAQISTLANSEFEAFCRSEFNQLRERTDVLRTDVNQLQTQLHRLEAQFKSQVTFTLINPGDVGRKLLIEQTTVQLTHHVKDLEFYLPPTVIKALPREMSLDALMTRLNTSSQTGAGEQKAAEEEKSVGTALPERFDAIGVIDEFLNQDEALLLLLGEPGAGKSLSTWQATRRLVAQFQPNMTGQQISQCWLPLHIELNQFSLHELNGLIDQQLKAVYHLSDAAIAKLKQTSPSQSSEPKVLLILDGYDELRQDKTETQKTNRRDHTDLFHRIGGDTWKKGQIKVLVTCRRRYLNDESEERMIFGVGQYQRYQRFELLPFTLVQIHQYVEARSSQDVGGGLLRPERYFQTIQSSVSIQTLISNPFVLQLFLESLPRLAQSGQDTTHLVRYDLYRAFFDQWIEREVRRFTSVKKDALGRDTDVALVNDFKRMARYLALSMYAKGTITVEFIKPKQTTTEYQVWFNVLKQNAEEANQEYLAFPEDSGETEDDLYGLEASQPKPDKATIMRQAQARANQLADVLPLTRSGTAYRFVHKSFYEYLVVDSILHLTPEDKAFEAAALTFFKQRLIQTEPAVLSFLIELSSTRADIPSHPLFAGLSSTLFTIIQRSAQEPDLGQASSNAATILNMCDVQLTYQNWSNVQLPGADLSYCALAHSDLRSANLQGANLSHCMLYKAKLQGANLGDVQWGEYRWLKMERKVRVIAHHPTRPWLAIAQHNMIILKDRDTDRVIGQPMVTDGVTSMAFSLPDGAMLVSGNWDGTVYLWDIKTQQPIGQPMLGHKARINSIAFSPNGKLIVSGSGYNELMDDDLNYNDHYDNSVRLWDVQTQTELGALPGHLDQVHSVTFSPDGKNVAAGYGGDQSYTCSGVRLWDVKTQTIVGGSAIKGAERVTSIAFSPDGTQIFFGNIKGELQVWNVSTQTSPMKLMPESGYIVDPIAFSPDGTTVVLVSNTTLRLWNMKTQQFIGQPMLGHTNSITSITLSSDGAIVLSGSEDETVRIWDIKTQQQLIHQFIAEDQYRGFFSPDGTIVVSIKPYSHVLYLWDTQAQKLIGKLMHENTDDIARVVFSPDGGTLASWGRKSVAYLWDRQTQRLIGQLRADVAGKMGYINSVAFSPNGVEVLVGSSRGHSSGIESETLHLWNRQTQHLIAQWNGGGGFWRSVSDVAFSPDGVIMASGDDKALHLWDRQTQKAIGQAMDCGTRHYSSNEVVNMAFSPDGSMLVASSASYEMEANNYGSSLHNVVLLWSTKTQQRIGQPLVGHTYKVTSVVFNPDSTMVLSSSDDKTLRLWNIAQIKSMGLTDATILLTWHQKINSIAFAPYFLKKAAKATSEEKSSHIFSNHSSSSYVPEREDMLMMRDDAGAISFWALSREHNPQIRFLWMPKHISMPLFLIDTQLGGCQMSAMSRRLLEQYGADVSQVRVVEQTSVAPAESKHAASTTTASSPPKRPPPPPKSTSNSNTASLSSAASTGFFSTANSSASTTNSTRSSPGESKTIPTSSTARTRSPAAKSAVDPKAQSLLAEVLDLLDEVYSADEAEVAEERSAMLAELKPYQDCQASLTTADRTKLRKLQLALEDIQASKTAPILES